MTLLARDKDQVRRRRVRLLANLVLSVTQLRFTFLLSLPLTFAPKEEPTILESSCLHLSLSLSLSLSLLLTYFPPNCPQLKKKKPMYALKQVLFKSL